MDQLEITFHSAAVLVVPVSVRLTLSLVHAVLKLPRPHQLILQSYHFPCQFGVRLQLFLQTLFQSLPLQLLVLQLLQEHFDARHLEALIQRIPPGSKLETARIHEKELSLSVSLL